MKAADSAVELEVERVQATTDKALLCQIDGVDYWIPKSQVLDGGDLDAQADVGAEGTILVTERWARDRGARLMPIPCKTCGAPLIFALTAKGRRMPLDPDPVAGGNLLLTQEATELRAAVVDSLSQPVARPLYRSHFAVCPGAATHRRRRSA